MATAQKPSRAENGTDKKAFGAFGQNSNSNSNSQRDFNHHSDQQQLGEPTRSSFVIPPPSRKYTTTNPGTLSPIYHLVYDLTAPTTVTSTSTSAFLDTRITPSHLSINSSTIVPSNNLHSPIERQSHPGAFDAENQALSNNNNSRQVRDGFSQSSYPYLPDSAVNSSDLSNNYPADKRRLRKNKELRNGDAESTSHNKTNSDALFSSADAVTDVDERGDNRRQPFFHHSSKQSFTNTTTVSENKTHHYPNHYDHHHGHQPEHWSTNNDTETNNDGGARSFSGEHPRLAYPADHSQENLILAHSRVPNDISKSQSSNLSHNRYDINNVTSERAHNALLITEDDNQSKGTAISGQQVSVKQAIDIWSKRSEGDEGISGESNSLASYQQGELQANPKRAVFKRDGDCVRLFLVNNDSGDNSNNSVATPRMNNDDDGSNGDIIIQAVSQSGDNFRRGEKANTSQRWLNKLGLLGLRGSNSKSKSNRKKDSETAKLNRQLSSSSDNASGNKDKDKRAGEDGRPQVSKKPLNRWDSIHVHTRQDMIASATGLETQSTLNQAKEVSFAQQVVTPPNGSGHQNNVAVLTPGGTYRPSSNSTNGDTVTVNNYKDNDTSKPVIKGILVNRAKTYDTNAVSHNNNRSGQHARHNGVQFVYDMATSSSSSFPTTSSSSSFSHTNQLFTTQLSSSSSFPSSMNSPPRREVIDRNKYIIKHRKNRTAQNNPDDFNQSQESVLSFDSDTTFSALDNTNNNTNNITKSVTNAHTCEVERSPGLGFDPTVIIHEDNRYSKEQSSNSNTRMSRIQQEKGQSNAPSTNTRYQQSLPCGGSEDKHAGGSVHKVHPYTPLLGGRCNHSDNRKIKERKSSGLGGRLEDNSYGPFPYPNYHNENHNIPVTDETFLDSNEDPRVGHPGYPVSDHTMLSLLSSAHGGEERVGFANHSSVSHRDTVTDTVCGVDKRVEGDDTLRYRRALREIGKKNIKNLFNVDQNSQWIKQRLEDLNNTTVFENNGRSISTSQISGDPPTIRRRGASEAVELKPKPNPKPKITPRQKFEITHNRLSGKVASNLRHNHNGLNPLPVPLSNTNSSHLDSLISKPINGPNDLATSPLYKESPRAKFERDRAARTNNNINNNNNNNLYSINNNTVVSSGSGLNTPCSERLNKSCDHLETDSDGYLKPSVSHKSHSTETLLWPFYPDSQTPLSPTSKLSPRARFENSRAHGNPKPRNETFVSEDPSGRDDCQILISKDSWTNSFSDLEGRLSQSTVKGQSTNHKFQPEILTSLPTGQRAFAYSTEQRNHFTNNRDVRSVHSSGKERDETEIELRQSGSGGSGGQYGTSVEERFLSQQQYTTRSLSSSANIDTNAPRWSGADDEEGIKIASDERRAAKQLNKSRAEVSFHTAVDGSINKPVLDRTDIQSVQQQDKRLPEGNFKFSSTNFASSDKHAVISNTSLPSGDKGGGGSHEEANSAGYDNNINVSHGSSGRSEVPGPSQVTAVKKMSPDSVSSSGYESEHTSSAIFHKNSRNNNSNNNNLKNYNNSNNNNNSLERKAGVSTVQELRLRFGHYQQQQTSLDAKNNQWNKYVDSSNQRIPVNGGDRVNASSNFNGGTHAILSDDQYDDSLAPRSHASTCRVSNVNDLHPIRADVNNNNNKNRRVNNSESDTCLRYDFAKDTHFRDDNNNNGNRNNNRGDDKGFSDSQIFNSKPPKNRVVKFEGDPIPGAKQRFSPQDRRSPKEKKHHNKLEKVSRSMHEIIHDLKLDSGEPQTSNKRNHRRSRRCSKCQDNSSPNFCSFCKHYLDRSRDSVDSEGIPSSPNQKSIVFSSEIANANDFKERNSNSFYDSTTKQFVVKQNCVSHSISEVAAMLASKGLRIYEDTGEYVPMKNPVKLSPTVPAVPGRAFNLEAASYLIVPTVVESFTSNSSKTLHSNNANTTCSFSDDNAFDDETTTRTKSQRQLALDALAQRSISDSGASAGRSMMSLAREDEINNGALSDGDICDDDAYLSMDLAGVRPRAMSMDMLYSDGAIPDAEDSTDAESSSAPLQKVTTRLRRRRSSKGYVEWRTCSGWVGKTDMRLAEGRNSRGYIEWDTIWTTATPWKGEGAEDEHVYDVIEDESASQTQGETETETTQQAVSTAENANPVTIDTPPALPERTYINRLKNSNSTTQASRRHSPHHHHQHHQHHHHHHGSHHHSHHHHHGQRHQHQSHSQSGGRRSHGHHHRSSPQMSSATPKLKSASKKRPPPAPPVQTTQESLPDSQNYAVVSKLKGYTFSDPLTSSSLTASHQSTDKSVIYSENYWHLGPNTAEEKMTSWQSGDVLDYIDGLHDSMSPKRRENIYILLNNKKTRAKFSESLEIESRLLSKGLLCSLNSQKQKDNEGVSNVESMDTSPATSTSTTHDHAILSASGQNTGVSGVRKARTSVSSTYV